MVYEVRLVQFSGFLYTSGQGGTPLYVHEIANVESAAVVAVSQYSGSLEMVGDVVGVSLMSGSVATAPSPTTNEVLIQLFENSAGTLTEIATGTISGTVNLMVTGF